MQATIIGTDHPDHRVVGADGVERGERIVTGDGHGDAPQRRRDAELIANAPADLTDLCDEVERLRKHVAELLPVVRRHLRRRPLGPGRYDDKIGDFRWDDTGDPTGDALLARIDAGEFGTVTQ